MALINIQGLRLETILGFWPEEREAKQRVIIHISFEVDEKDIVKHDDVKYAVDYHKLTEELIEKVPATKFNMIESLTHFVMEVVMSRKQVSYAKVTVEKPDAPLRMVDKVSCVLEKRR